MSNALLLAALAATGITYEWRSVDDAQGGHEYVVTVEPGLLQAALDGKAKSFRSDVPDDVERIRSVVVNLGEGAAEPVRHGVLKPPIDADAAADEEFAPIRHSVYQQTYPPQTYPPQAYPNPTAIEQGFSDYNAAVEPRKSIGSEVAKGTEKLLNGTGRIIQDTGEAIEGTAKNIGDGFRSIVKPSSVTPTGGVAAPQASGTYQPFSYNQPTPNPNYNAGGAYPPLPTQPGVSAQAGQAYPGSQSYPGGMNQPPIGPPVSVQQAPQNQNAPTYPPSNQPPAGGNGPSSADPSQFASQRSNTGGQAYVDFAPQRDEPFAPIRDAQPTGNTPDYRSNQGPNSQPPNNQQPNGGQNYAAGQNNQPPSATNDSWPDWPDASQTAGNQNQYPQNNGGPYPGSPTTAGYGSTPGAQAPYPAAWNPNAIDGPSIADTQQRNQQDAANATNNPGGGGKQGWYAVVAVAAIGSIAWNFYLGMNYIDARNKYRAALRRSGRAYSEVLDDM